MWSMFKNLFSTQSVDINPATGLLMTNGVGGVDTSGHVWGESADNSCDTSWLDDSWNSSDTSTNDWSSDCGSSFDSNSWD